MSGDSNEFGPASVMGTIAGCLGLLTAIIFLFVGGCISQWVGNAHKTAYNEFSPSALLHKYQWFKDVAAELDKKQADIKVYEQRFASLKEAYGDSARTKWAREDREQWNIWSGEIAGIKASYNSLAAEYNSNMAKFNWKFTNIGDLPDGANKVLPREYRTYEER